MARHAHCNVEVRAINPSTAGAAALARFGSTWFVQDGDALVFRSQLHESGDVDQHMHFLFRMLQHGRKLFRRLRAEGMDLVVRVYCDRLPVKIAPESLLLGHKMQLPIELVLRKR